MSSAATVVFTLSTLLSSKTAVTQPRTNLHADSGATFNPVSNYAPMFDEPSSAALPVAYTKVLFITPNYTELKRVFETLLSNNLRPVHLEGLPAQPVRKGAFRHVFIDLSLPNAQEWLRDLGPSQDEVFPIALIQRGEREGSALAAGACATLQLPIEAEDVLLCIERNCARIERSRSLQELMDRDRRRIATTSVEGVLTTLCQELRNPLAAALANVEYLREAAHGATVAVSSEEKRNILEDTLDALQRVRGTLESLATLVKKEITEPRRIVFWEVAQSVIDELGCNAASITLTGEPTVRGWADEELLRQVVSTLVHRARCSTHTNDPAPPVQMRVYATETEARISVRDEGPALSAEIIKSLFEPSYAMSGKGSAELLLAVTHHAVVRMGGVLDYAHRNSPGGVFRIRLRLARTYD
jgi:signal transduction histidine kinase